MFLGLSISLLRLQLEFGKLGISFLLSWNIFSCHQVVLGKHIQIGKCNFIIHKIAKSCKKLFFFSIVSRNIKFCVAQSTHYPWFELIKQCLVWFSLKFKLYSDFREKLHLPVTQTLILRKPLFSSISHTDFWAPKKTLHFPLDIYLAFPSAFPPWFIASCFCLPQFIQHQWKRG